MGQSAWRFAATHHGPRTTTRQAGLRISFPTSNELLDSMIHGVGDVQVPSRIEREAPRIAESSGRCAGFPEHFHRPMIAIEDLDAAVPELADKLVAFRVHFHVVGITQLALTGTRFAVSFDKFSVRRKNLDAMIARIGDVDTVLPIDAQTLGAIKLSVASPARSQDTHQFRPLRRELLHALGQAVLAHENIALRVHYDRTRKSQFALVRSVRAPLRGPFAVRSKM